MRLLFTIPHFFDGSRDGSAKPDSDKPNKYASQTSTSSERVNAVRETVYSLHQTFGHSQAMIELANRRTVPANGDAKHEIHVVMAVSGNSHLLNETVFSPEMCQTMPIDGDPMHLGFHCHNIMRDRWGNYDYYGYLEDDLALTDPWFFEKLRWFNGHVGDEKVLLPNRFERANSAVYKKCYLDGDLADHVTTPFQDISKEPELSSTVMGKSIRFARPRNPHSGCFFLNASQMKTWINRPDFGTPTSDFVGPLESAASLGVMKTFQVYKPAIENANFLEIEHYGTRFSDLVRVPTDDVN